MTGIIFVILAAIALGCTLASIIAFLTRISRSPGSGGEGCFVLLLVFLCALAVMLICAGL